MKKRFYIFTLCSILFLTLISTNAFGKDESVDGSLRKFSSKEIKERSLKKLRGFERNEVQNKIERPKSARFDGMYNEWPVAYDPDYVKVDKEAFEIAEFTFDTWGHPEKYKKVSVKYSGGQTVSWAITGTAEASAEFKILKKGIEASASVSITRDSTISNSVTAEAPYYIERNSTGSIPIYAYGYKTGGAMKYKWDDVMGNSGFKYKDIRSQVPYRKYSSSYIKFGRISYD